MHGCDWGSISCSSGSALTDIGHRLRIMKFCDKMTLSLYRNPSDPAEGVGEDHISSVWSQLNADLDELEPLAEDFSRKLLENLTISIPANSKPLLILLTSKLSIGCHCSLRKFTSLPLLFTSLLCHPSASRQSLPRITQLSPSYKGFSIQICSPSYTARIICSEP
jgi:hypothetical protein